MLRTGDVRHCGIMQLLFGNVSGSVYDKLDQLGHFFQAKETDTVAQVLRSLRAFFDRRIKVADSLVSVTRAKSIKPK